MILFVILNSISNFKQEKLICACFLFTSQRMGKTGKYPTLKQHIDQIRDKIKEMENPKPKGVNFSPFLILDTTYKTQKEGTMRWEENFDFFQERGWLSNTRSSQTKKNQFKAIRETKLHKVAARGRSFPYYDMVSWIFSHANIKS